MPRGKTQDYKTQVYEETEERVTKKTSQVFRRPENRKIGALSRLNDFSMNPLIQGHSGTAPETSPNALGTNQRPNEDDSQSDPHLEAGIFHDQMTRTSGPDDGQDSDNAQESISTQYTLVLVAAHLRGMRPAPTSKKDTIMLKEKLKINTKNQFLNYLLLDYFQLLYK